MDNTEKVLIFLGVGILGAGVVWAVSTISHQNSLPVNGAAPGYTGSGNPAGYTGTGQPAGNSGGTGTINSNGMAGNPTGINTTADWILNAVAAGGWDASMHTPHENIQASIDSILNGTGYAQQRTNWKAQNYSEDQAAQIIWQEAVKDNTGTNSKGYSFTPPSDSYTTYNYPNIDSVIGNGTAKTSGSSGTSGTLGTVLTVVEDVAGAVAMFG